LEEPAREPRLAPTTARLVLAVEVREHNFMREKRQPFRGVGAVGIGAADKVVLTIWPPNQFGLAELADNLLR
jgi:hypothetical protein